MFCTNCNKEIKENTVLRRWPPLMKAGVIVLLAASIAGGVFFVKGKSKEALDNVGGTLLTDETVLEDEGRQGLGSLDAAVDGSVTTGENMAEGHMQREVEQADSDSSGNMDPT